METKIKDNIGLVPRSSSEEIDLLHYELRSREIFADHSSQSLKYDSRGTYFESFVAQLQRTLT